MVLSAGHDLTSLSFAGSTAKNTSGCGMASGRTVLDHRVRNARIVGRGTGHSRPMSPAADDMQAQAGGGAEIRDDEAKQISISIIPVDEFNNLKRESMANRKKPASAESKKPSYAQTVKQPT